MSRSVEHEVQAPILLLSGVQHWSERDGKTIIDI